MSDHVIEIPELCLVLLVGVSGSGKSTFAAQHFAPTEVISSDYCRALVSDDENDQSATADAFDVLNYIVGKRLAAGRLTVVDATNIQPNARASLISLAKNHDVLSVAIVLDLPESVCAQRTEARADRAFGAEVVKRQYSTMQRGLKRLRKEGVSSVARLESLDDVAAASIVRAKLFNDRKDVHGPFDVIGDVHGCRLELEKLLEKLGWELERGPEGKAVNASHPEGRQAIFLGDLVDRGPDTPGVLRLAKAMAESGRAHAVTGNHEAKLVKALAGRKVAMRYGLQESMDQFAREDEAFRTEMREWMDTLISHLIFDDGKLVVSHAGILEKYQGRASGRVRSFCLYGDTTGENDEYGLPVRYPWALEYRGDAMVLYGHTPVVEAEWVNNTMCLDTGCCFGGKLSALRYPEKEVVEVQAAEIYFEPSRPLETVEGGSPDVARAHLGEALNITDVLGSGGVETEHLGRVTIREENAAAALEIASRYSLAPGWVPYLPPTMTPVPASTRDGYLEHPLDAFAAFRKDGIERVMCQEKHMGSRAVIAVCADGSVARERFGSATDRDGMVYTRTGRAFFDDETNDALVSRVKAAVAAAGLFDELTTGWLLFDVEILPWNAKAAALLRTQYAPVGAASAHALDASIALLAQAGARGLDVSDLQGRTARRRSNALNYATAYRQYCWDVDGLDGIEIAPFQLLAAEGQTFETQDHAWHMGIADRLKVADDALFRATRRTEVTTSDEESCAAGAEWWQDMVDAGGEGMVVKPFANFVRAKRGVVQPGIKVRGPEYLRIIYGPDYLDERHLARLKGRNVNRKRSLATREYALGLESLTRFAHDEPAWKVHQAVFAVLALESEPVDPRL